MRKSKRSFRTHAFHSKSQAIVVEGGPPRIIAMSLATELADAVGADAEERQFLVNVALDVGQWLADRGVPGRWDKVKPAAVLRCLDFLAPKERERVLFSMAGLLGHAAFHGRLSPRSARQSLAEIVGLSQDDAIRSFARTASEQLQEMTA